MYIASVSNDVKIHTWPNGQLLHTYKSNFQGSIKSISWGKDGSWLVVVPSKGPAEVISIKEDIKNLRFIHEIQQPTCAAFQNSTKRNIALGTTTGSVLVYDIKSNSVRKHFPRAPSTVFKVEYCAKDSFLVAACENGEIMLYNSVMYNLSSSYKVPNSRTVSNVRCHPNKRNLIIGGSQEGMVALWDIHTSKFKYSNQAHSAPVTDLAFSPTRDDLIVTCGLDRKFAFFDTKLNNCIIQKIMERSVSSVDFCPDGVGLAVAMQNGIVHTYDTRQMNEPLYSFTAHQTQIKQLLFQKNRQQYDDSCEYNFTEDKLESGDNFDSSKEIILGQSFESFGQFCGEVLSDIPEVVTEDGLHELGDSFMDTMGLNSQTVSGQSHNVTTEYPQNGVTGNSIKHHNMLGISDGVKKLLDSKPNLLESSTHEPLFLGHLKSEEHLIHCATELRIPIDRVKSQIISTSKSGNGVVPTSYISPIINHNTTDTINPKAVSNINFADLQNVIRNTIKIEMKHEQDIFKQELKYEFMDIMGQIRRHFLDLQMSIVKEFIHIESNFNKLRQDMNTDECFGDDLLIQENMQLRKELASLREQISNTKD